ncbi:MAG: sulfite exporter TauE/SafE family protein [Acidimicrobiales bacterium]
MSAATLVLGLACVTVGATVQATIGFGAALVSVPLLLLVDPRFVPGPIAVAGLAVNVTMAVTQRAHADWPGVRWLAIGLVPGVAVAGLALAAVSGPSLALLSAAAILVAVAISAADRRPPRGRWTLLGAGFFSGYMGTSAGIGGPPLALCYQDAPPRTLRATFAVVFLLTAPLTLATLRVTGHLDASALRAGVALVPGGLLGFALSRPLAGRLADRQVRPVVLAFAALSAAAVIIRVAI